MSVSDRRRAPFCWLSIAALDLIARNVPEGTVAGVRNTYLGLAQVAAAARDGHHEGFEAALAEIASAAHVDRATVKRHLPILVELGLLEVEQRTAGNGATLASCYVLLEPGQREIAPSEKGGGHDAPPPAHDAPPPVHGEAHDAPPTRARQTAVKKEEEPHPPNPPQAGGAGSHRRSRAKGTNPRALEAQAATAAARGPEPDPPTAEITEAWRAIRAELTTATANRLGILYLEALELTGTRGTELVLTSPPQKAAYTADRYGKLITAAARHHLGAATTVAILPAEHPVAA